MAKSGSDELVTKTSKSASSRRFPWRLWMWTVAMTIGAGAGAYYTWTYRSQRNSADDQAQACRKDLTAEKIKTADLDTKKKQLDECAIKLGEEKKKADGYQALNASQAVAPAPVAGDPGQRAEVDKRNVAADDIAKQFAKAPNVAVSARRGLLVLTLPADAIFAAGGAELNEAGKTAVAQIGEMLKRYPDRRFSIVGHTSDKGTFKDSWELSAERAISIVRQFVQNGVDAHNLIAGGAGDGDPTKEPAKNHRIEIALLPSAGELAALPASLGADTAKPDAAAPTPPAPTPSAPAPAAGSAAPAAGSAAPAAATPAAGSAPAKK